MSPLFHRGDDDNGGEGHHGRLPSLAELGPQLMVAVDTICWDLLPDNSGEHAGQPIPDAFFSLQDLVTAALQLLRTAGLVMERSYKVGQDHGGGQWLDGLVTMRRGRAALPGGTVGQIVGRVYAQPA